MVPTKTATLTALGALAVDHSDARLRALTEYALEIITVQDASGAFTYVNEAVTRYLGYAVSDLLGRNAAEFLHPDDTDAMRERFRAVMASEITPQDLNRFEYRFRHRDGSWCWLESVAVNALGNPAVVGVIAHSRDISWRKANERILLLNHARYRTVADLSAGAVHEYVMNAAGVYELEWVHGTERVYGCNEQEYRRLGWKSFHVGEGWEEASIARTQRYLAGETIEFLVKIRRADGQIRWVEVKNRPIAEPSTGKFTRLVGVAVDITERKQAGDALRESEFRYRTVAELTSGFVYEATVDEAGETQVIWASPGFETFFGCTIEDLNRVGWRSFFLPADHAGAIQRRKRIREGERTEMELALKTFRGDTRWIHLANQPVIGFDGTVERYIGVVHDITDRKVNEEVLRSQALAIEVMHEGVVLSDSAGVIRMTNPALDRMFGTVAGSLIGKHLRALPCDPPLDRRIAESADQATASTGAPLVSELMVRGSQEGDATLFVEAAITSLVLRGERFWLTVLQDATTRRLLEREVLEASNREQQRIGNDLHDGLGQELTGIALLLRGREPRRTRGTGAFRVYRGDRAAGQRRDLHHACAGARPVTGHLRSRRPGTGARGTGAAPVGDVPHQRALRGRRPARSRTRIGECPAPVPHRAGGRHQCRATRRRRAGVYCAALRRRAWAAAHRGQRQRLQSGDAAVQGPGAAHHALPRADDGRQPAHRERESARNGGELLVPAG